MRNRHHIRLPVNAAIVAIMVAPLIAASIWIYGASSAAFRYQYEIRKAQDAKDALFSAFLATESDVRGFAATGDPRFAVLFRARERTFKILATALLREMHLLKLSGESTLIGREQQTYAQWHRRFATPILDGDRANTAKLLRVVDPALARRMSSDDRSIGAMLNSAATASERGRRNLLSHLLAGSVLLVALIASAAIFLIRRHASAEQRELKQTVLYEEERRVSEILQRAITPGGPPGIDGVTLRAKYVPATHDRQIGGDWYEAIPLQRGRTLLIIGDVAGHGLEAAASMNRVRHALLRAALTDSDPARILQTANRSLTDGLSGMVTAACCVFDPGTMTLCCAMAGHPPPVVVPAAGSAYMLAYGGPPLGIVDELEIQSQCYPLGPGTLVVLYTDGLIEECRDLVQSERCLLAAAQGSAQSHDPAGGIFTALLTDGRARDDVAILTMRVNPSCVVSQPGREFPSRSSDVICSSRETTGRA